MTGRHPLSTKLPLMWKWFALGSAFFAALQTILAKIGIQGVPSNLGTAIRTVVVLVLAWGLVFARGENKVIPTISNQTWTFLVLSGVATALSWLCYYKALELGDVKYVVPIDKLSLPLTIVLAFLILKEQWTITTTIGVILITAGTYVLTIPNKPNPTMTAPKPAPSLPPTPHQNQLSSADSIGGVTNQRNKLN